MVYISVIITHYITNNISSWYGPLWAAFCVLHQHLSFRLVGTPLGCCNSAFTDVINCRFFTVYNVIKHQLKFMSQWFFNIIRLKFWNWFEGLNLIWDSESPIFIMQVLTSLFLCYVPDCFDGMLIAFLCFLFHCIPINWHESAKSPSKWIGTPPPPARFYLTLGNLISKLCDNLIIRSHDLLIFFSVCLSTCSYCELLCLSVILYLCLFVFWSMSVSIPLSVCLSVSCPTIQPLFSPSVCLSVQLPILSVCTIPFICPYVQLFQCVIICLSIYLPVSSSIYLFHSPHDTWLNTHRKEKCSR